MRRYFSQKESVLTTLYLWIHLGVYVCGGPRMTCGSWISPNMGSRLQVQGISIGGMYPYHLSHLSSPLQPSFWFSLPNNLFPPFYIDPLPSQTSLPTTYIPTFCSLVDCFLDTLMFHWFTYFTYSSGMMLFLSHLQLWFPLSVKILPLCIR